MQRKILDYLQQWLVSQGRKPLVLRGARQVGKTWVVQQLAAIANRQLLVLNFEKESALRSLFVTNDLKQILPALESYFQVAIKPQQQLLFLDEMQAFPDMLAKLRWFYEDYPELPVIAAGSLLDFAIADANFSMPVGRISYAYLEPMSFEEFLLALGQEQAIKFFEHYQIGDTIPEVLHEKFFALLREYILVGGMPEAVQSWVDTQKQKERSFAAVAAIQQNLLTTYIDDFNKYAGRIAPEHLLAVFRTVPDNLGRKFKYSNVSLSSARSAVLKTSLELLCKARVCHKIYASAANGIPLAAEIRPKHFKTTFIDVGLVSASLKLNINDLTGAAAFKLVNDGGIAEQLVGQLLRTTFPFYMDAELYYWLREEPGAIAEIDYLLQHRATIIPIEVKAGKSGTLRSLHSFVQNKQSKLAVRFNADQPSWHKLEVKMPADIALSYQLLSLPLYLVEQLPRLLALVE